MGGQIPRRLFVKRGVYYFERRVPKALQSRFGRIRIRLCLHTRSHGEALKAAQLISTQLDMAWNQARLESMGLTGVAPPTFLSMTAAPIGNLQPSKPFVMSDAFQTYVRLKGRGKGQLFFSSAERNFKYATECLGDVSITDLRRVDATKFRDHLIEKGLSTASIRRTLATIRAAINLAISEQGLNCQNPFTRIFIPAVGEKKVRPPIPIERIRSIQQECVDLDDNRRHLIALVSDTGMRLSEAVGLVKDDLHLDGPFPFVDIRPHPWRKLKTEASARQIPLVGASLWAAKRAKRSAKGEYLFPEYAGRNGCNANSASAALNKFLRPRLPKGCVIHSLRHSLRDRLRAVECDPSIIDEIGGWSRQTIGDGYGSGYPLEVKAKWMARIT